MSSESRNVSKPAKWIGWVLSTLPVLLLLMGPVMYMTNRAMVIDGMEKHGYPTRVALPLVIVELVCAILYAIPQTAVLGAVLLTGYLGGAVATHVRVGEPWFFPVIVGVVIWLGLFLRDRRVRALLPLRT
jgi:hypothetical protein